MERPVTVQEMRKPESQARPMAYASPPAHVSLPNRLVISLAQPLGLPWIALGPVEQAASE